MLINWHKASHSCLFIGNSAEETGYSLLLILNELPRMTIKIRNQARFFLDDELFGSGDILLPTCCVPKTMGSRCDLWKFSNISIRQIGQHYISLLYLHKVSSNLGTTGMMERSPPSWVVTGHAMHSLPPELPELD